MNKLVIQKLTKTKVKARIALVGPTGSGKTYTATMLARELTPGRILVIDSERGSADRYADIFNTDDRVDHIRLPNHNPDTYVQALELAASEGYGAVIVDSLSHAWMGHEGALEQIDKLAKRNQFGGSFNAWREVTPMHNRLVNALLDLPAHLIVTMRTKTAYEVTKDEKGKASVQKLGLAPVQREGIEFEFDIVGDMDADNNFIVTKTRMASLGGAVVHKPGPKLGRQITEWLNSGQSDFAVTLKETSYLDRRLPAMPTESEKEAGVAYLKHTCEFTKSQFDILKEAATTAKINWCFVILEAKRRDITELSEIVALVNGCEPIDPKLPDDTPVSDAPSMDVVAEQIGTYARHKQQIDVEAMDVVAEQIGTYARHKQQIDVEDASEAKAKPIDTAFGFKISKMPIERQFELSMSDGQSRLLASKFIQRHIDGELVGKLGDLLAKSFGVKPKSSGWAAMVIEFLSEASDDSLNLAVAEAENPQGSFN